MEKLDKLLIGVTERFVHYLILYKSYTWKEIGDLLRKLNDLLCNIMIFFALAALFILNPVVILISVIIISQKRTGEIYNSALKERQGTTIPRERVHRYLERFISLMYLILITSMCVGVFITVANDQQHPHDEEFYVTMFTVFFVWIASMICICAIEYFLCTSPPPPGEKERRLVEKETQNLATQKISG